jgi:hypothetical protein
VNRKIKSFEVSNFVAFHHYCAIRLICNYIFLDGCILWCTHSLLLLETCLMMIQKSLPKVSINITWSTGSSKAHIWYSIFCPLHLVHLRTMYILNCIQGSSWDHMVVGYTTTYAASCNINTYLGQALLYHHQTCF